MKKLIAGALALGVLVSGSAFALKMTCEYCNINGQTGEMTCYNCRFE